MLTDNDSEVMKALQEDFQSNFIKYQNIVHQQLFTYYLKGYIFPFLNLFGYSYNLGIPIALKENHITKEIYMYCSACVTTVINLWYYSYSQGRGHCPVLLRKASVLQHMRFEQ
eukprot:Pgem_evm7s12025